MKGILGRKIGMTQIFSEEGVAIPVTVVEAGPVVITQIKTVDKEGYNAIQVGFEELKPSRANKPLKGHFDKAGIGYKKILKEFSVEDPSEYQVGQEIKVDVFAEGDKVDVTGISKGKGTQGPIKRHGQARGPMKHGSKYHRGAGSLGATSDPSRVFKGQTGAGRMGREKVTIQNLEVVKVYPERNALLIKGAIPGPKGAVVVVKEAVKVAK